MTVTDGTRRPRRDFRPADCATNPAEPMMSGIRAPAVSPNMTIGTPSRSANSSARRTFHAFTMDVLGTLHREIIDQDGDRPTVQLGSAHQFPVTGGRTRIRRLLQSANVPDLAERSGIDETVDPFPGCRLAGPIESLDPLATAHLVPNTENLVRNTSFRSNRPAHSSQSSPPPPPPPPPPLLPFRISIRFSGLSLSVDSSAGLAGRTKPR